MSRRIRDITIPEANIISRLLELAKVNDNRLSEQILHAKVSSMSDGSMGSIRFYNRNSEIKKFGRDLVSATSRDSDGVEMIITLILDDHDDLYELEIWKVDFSSTTRLPMPEDIFLRSGFAS